MEYIAVLNIYLEYSLDDNHTENLSFQSTSIHVFHVASVYKMLCWQRHRYGFPFSGHSLNLTH